MHPDYSPPWSEDRENELKQWYMFIDKGGYLNKGQIAAKMKATRLAVTGKIKRLKLTRPELEGVAPRPVAPPRPARVVVDLPRDPVPVTGRAPNAVVFDELTSKTCHYPIGAPRTPTFHFCGEPVDPSKSGYFYCKFHYKVCYTPVRSRSDSRPHYVHNKY